MLIRSLSNTDPYTPPPLPVHQPPIILPPTPVAVPVIRCRRHQAPSGYEYRLIAGRCMLWRKHGMAVRLPTQAGLGFIYQNPTPNATATNVVSGVMNWVQNNKLLALGLAAGGYYYLTKKK